LLRLLLGRVLAGFRLHGPAWVAEVAVLNVAIVAVAFVRYGGSIPDTYRSRRELGAFALITLAYTFFDVVLRTYRIVWRFATIQSMVRLGLTVLGAFVIMGAVELGPMAARRPIPLSVLALSAAVAYLAMAHLKMVARARQAVAPDRTRQPIVVFGAGLGGVALVRQLAHERTGYRPVAFLDDDDRKVGRVVAGIPVVGTRADLGRVVKRYRAEAVAIAIPSANSQVIREITHLVLDADARALALPSITKLMAGSDLTLQDIGIEDLVGRSEVTVDEPSIRATFSGRRVLVTGAAGSIGSELARQIAALRPAHLDLIDNNESGLADLRDELSIHQIALSISVVSITDRSAVESVFERARPDVVIHAAALKHVDIVEEQARAAIEVNVHGTWVCAGAAERAGAQRFILVSTDKAVDPVGVLGMTKRIGELMMGSLSTSPTIFAAVRFGNVLGSRGSVLPKFERQIRGGGPITVTHPDMRRYFMSIAEAVRLVLQSAAFAEGGHTYVLDMGEELRIAEFAQRLARLRGLRVPQDIDLVFTGLRAGERLTEKLIGKDESAQATAHSKIEDVTTRAAESSCHWDTLVADLLTSAASSDAPELRARLLALTDPANARASATS
jgi:FlaA1/EpsC-like NDP-sugar epimerase